MSQPIAIASDHAAIELKSALIDFLCTHGYAVTDLGAQAGESVDYPDYGYKLARYLADGKAERGIALCGSGIGISIAANRHPKARCALVSSGLAAKLARRHNDANILAMGARLIGIEVAKDCVLSFLETEFEGGRHQARVD